VDDLPPATVITDPAAGATARLVDGVLVIRGTTTDNTRSVRVVVNGVEARDVDFNFHQWEAKLTGLEPGQLTLTATAEDAAGNREQTPHRISVVVQR
jgi:archaellum component FlaG (FlaF/FlaG flagellin family)